MKKDKIVAMFFFAASICFYLVAALNFVFQKDVIGGLFWLSIGTVWMFLGITETKRYKKEDENKTDQGGVKS